MFEALAKRLFGSANDRYLKPLKNRVDSINALESELESLSDKEIKPQTPQLKKRLQSC